MSRPVPPHGTPARAKGTHTGSRPPCHCSPCRDALNRVNKRYKVNSALGRSAYVPREPVAAHVRALMELNWTQQAIAEAAKLRQGTVSNIVLGKRLRVHQETARRLLALPLEERTPHLVPAVGTMRRLRALFAIGHGVAALGRGAGVELTYISDLMSGRQTQVSAALADRVRELYGAWRWKPGASKHGPTLARKRGWPGPFAWADLDMDDPDSMPDVDDGSESAVAAGDDLDYQAIYRALTGERVRLTEAETVAAVVEGRQRDLPFAVLADVLNVPEKDVRRIWDTTLQRVRRGGEMPERILDWHQAYSTAA